MEELFSRLRTSFMLLIVSMSIVFGSQSWAQTSTFEYEQAKLISKFAKYVSWPDDAIDAKFTIGIYEDIEKYEYFSSYYKNKGVKGKDILVRLIEKSSDTKDVNILYISFNKRSLLTSAVKKTKDSNVLIITENTNEIDKAMVDISYNKQKSKVTFKINDDNVFETELIIPELSYFLDDKNSEDVLSFSPTYLLKSQHSEQLLTLENQLTKQKSLLAEANKQLNLTKQSSEKASLALEKESQRLKTLQQENSKNSQEIKSKDVKIQDLEKQLKTRNSQLNMNKQDWQVSYEEKAKEQEKSIADLTEKLNKQKELTKNTTLKLTNMADKNKAQSSFQTLFYIAVLIAIIALIVAFLMWKKSKNLSSVSSQQPEGGELLPVREQQLVKSENYAALGFIATDINYGVSLSLEDLQAQLETVGDTKNSALLKPIVSLLENFNLIAADQDDNEFKSFNVIEYIEKMMTLYKIEFDQTDIEYSYSGEKELMIKSVPGYISLILIHVVNNSLKHGFDNNGNGKIALNVEKGAKGGAKITYSDDGKGMSKAIVNQMFEPFFTTQSGRGYVGIGMSFTADLIKKKLGGDIQVESKEGKGTTVIITLP